MDQNHQWIRGVNIGGWLLAERFITPYLFAVNSCHLQGDLCWYPGQVGAPENATLCNSAECEPVKTVFTSDSNADFHPRKSHAFEGYPIDELTLGQAFVNKEIGQKYMERHWDTFVTREDLVRLKEAGVTHMRVPMSYWVRGDIQEGESWIPGGWPFFVRFAKWSREIGLEIWADLHGAPGSENGFDNSGHYKGPPTCEGWQSAAENVQRTLDIIKDIADGMVEEGLTDVVTGFGLLNEPFYCELGGLQRYYNDAFEIVRNIMGSDTAIFVGDNFQGGQFNNGFWTDTDTHYNTYLDTHPYHVFFEKGRAFTPKQHIAYACRHSSAEVTACCWDDAPANTIPSKGISRIIGEWSAAYDMLPTAMAPVIMMTIAETGVAPHLNRTLSTERHGFMRNFVEAQMVTYESDFTGASSGWLFWNFKMEGGAFIEWDFLRGVKEGWIPHLPDPTVSSESVYGTCLDIYNRTSDDYNLIVDEYPDPRTLDWNQWQGWDVTDDFVMEDALPVRSGPARQYANWGAPVLIVLICIVAAVRKHKRSSKEGYAPLK